MYFAGPSDDISSEEDEVMVLLRRAEMVMDEGIINSVTSIIDPTFGAAP